MPLGLFWARLVVAIGALPLVLAACSSTTTAVPSGPSAYNVIPAVNGEQRALDYRIGPLDTLKVTVFQEPDLSFEKVPVDASGNILFPLIGQVEASGKTSLDLSREIAAKLGDRYLVDPQVSIIVSASVSQKVTVDGQVTEPGVYELQGQTTLLQAMAMAKGPTKTARLDEIVVFRTEGANRLAAKFDLRLIRSGRAADPQIRGNDVVVVGYSSAKGIFRDLLQATPVLSSLFIVLR